MTHKDVVALTGMIAGLSGSSALSAFGANIDALAPGWGRKSIAVISILSFAAGLVLRTTTANQRTDAAASTSEGLPHAK